MFVFVRVVVGLVFVVSGIEKVISPYQNFLYVIQGYDFLPAGVDRVAALVFPWAELFIGLFVLLGLWLRAALAGLCLMCLSLVVVVAQAIVRDLPLDSCGCFGDLVHLPLRGIILFDIGLLILAYLCLKKIASCSRWSLDSFLVQAR